MGASASKEKGSKGISGSSVNDDVKKKVKDALATPKNDDVTKKNETPGSDAGSKSGSQDKGQNYGSVEMNNSGQSQTKVGQPPRETTDSTDSYNKSDERGPIDGQNALNNLSNQVMEPTFK